MRYPALGGRRFIALFRRESFQFGKQLLHPGIGFLHVLDQRLHGLFDRIVGRAVDGIGAEFGFFRDNFFRAVEWLEDPEKAMAAKLKRRG